MDRRLKVYSKTRCCRANLLWKTRYEEVPQIILQGKWLKELGFDAGDSLDVSAERDRIIIRKQNRER